MRHPIFLGLTLAVATSTAAFAQNAPAPGQPMADLPGGRNVSCAEFLRLGEAAAVRVLYYADGYAAGIADQLASSAPTTTGSSTNNNNNNNNNKNNSSTAAANRAATTRDLPPATSGVTGPTDNSTASSTATLTALTIDQLRSLCQAEPRATVLSVVPGGRPVNSGGTATNNAGTTTGARATATSGGGGPPVTDTTSAMTRKATQPNSAAGGSPATPGATPGTSTAAPGTSTQGAGM